MQIFLFLSINYFGVALGVYVDVGVVCVFWGLQRGEREMEKGEREAEREGERREIAFLKRSETICCTENMFADGERYIC